MKEEKEEVTEEEKEEEVEEETEEKEEESTEEEKEEAPQAGEKDKFGRQMFNVKCSDCGKDCQVPFKPSGDRPVYCRDCYQKHRPQRRF